MNRFPRMVSAAAVGLRRSGQDGDSRQVIIKCGKDYHSTAFGGQCPDNNTGQPVYDTEDNRFSISLGK